LFAGGPGSSSSSASSRGGLSGIIGLLSLQNPSARMEEIRAKRTLAGISSFFDAQTTKVESKMSLDATVVPPRDS